MHPDIVTIPRGRPTEVDTSSPPAEGIDLPAGVVSLEVLSGPTADPYGTLVVQMADSLGSSDTLTRIEIGWEHAGAFARVMQGTDVTLIRVWT